MQGAGHKHCSQLRREFSQADDFVNVGTWKGKTLKMSKRIRCLFVALVASAGMTMTPSLGAADDFPCPPNMTGVISGNVVVAPGATCVIFSAQVRGNIKAHEGSRLLVDSSTVQGNIEGGKVDFVQVFDSFVGGSIHIIESQSDAAPAAVLRTVLADGNIQIEKGRDWFLIDNSLVKGNIKVEENNSVFGSTITGNKVGGNLQVFKNGGAGSKTVSGNLVLEDLQCFENSSPFLGSPNAATQAQGQCTATVSAQRGDYGSGLILTAR
jgi:hypothetical protein